MERFSSESSRGRARLPQRRCVADFMVRSPEYSPLRPYQSSSEDSSSEHSSSSSISSPGREKPTEIPKLCPPPYGFHFGAQKKGVSHFPSMHKNTSTSYVKAAAEDALICLTLNILMHWSCYFRKLDQWFQKCGLGYCKGTQVSMCAVIYIKSQVKLVVGGG